MSNPLVPSLDSLNYLRFRICLHLLEQYIPRELHPQTEDDEPDMLIRTMNSVTCPPSEYVDGFLFAQTVEELHIRYQINKWFLYDDSCLLNTYIRYMDPDYRALKQLQAGQWNSAFERYFSSLVMDPAIDLDLKEAARCHPEIKIIRPLEVALRGGQYRAAITLISRRANVNLVSIHDCSFMTGASLAFIYMTIFGFRFPSICELKKKITVDDEETIYWDAFIKWLEAHRRATESLTNMCLEKIVDDPPEIMRKLFRDYQWPPYIKDAIQMKRKNRVGALCEIGATKVLKRPRFGSASA